MFSAGIGFNPLSLTFLIYIDRIARHFQVEKGVEEKSAIFAVYNRVGNVWDESQHTQESEAMVLCQKKSGMVSLGRR